MSFIHLRTSSAFSLKYGTTQPRDLVERAAQFESPALALTDRDGLSGAIRFASACLEFGIAPIIGINLAIDLLADPNIKSAPAKDLPRVTILAHGDGGWRALVRLLSGLNMNAADRTPILTLDFLQRFSQYSTQLHLLHGPESPLSQALALHRSDIALDIFNKTRSLFGDHAIDCVSHLVAGNGPFSTGHAARSLIFARDHDIDAVITNAVRMRDGADGPVADILDCARQLVPLHQRHLERRNAEGYLKSSDQMISLAAEIARAAGERTPRDLLNTTRQWAERALLSPQRDLGLGGIHLPEAHIVGADSASAMRTLLRTRCESGINWRYNDSATINKARARLDDELATVATLGYEPYFLTVADITDMARDKNIRVAARGSGAGSLICHLLGISGVDPMQHGLLMERFCSPLRRALPDIDIDVESARRLEIYDLVFKRYGDTDWRSPQALSRCATVSMVDTYRARNAIRDVGAALGLPAMEIDLIAKSLPHIRARNIEATLKSLPELRSLNLSAPLTVMAISLAQRLDGLPRHLAMHPCAVVLSDAGLLDRAPVQFNASGYPMVEFDKDGVEEIGLLKLDILGVRMQSTIAHAVHDISLFRPGPVKSDMIRPFLNARHGWTNAQIIHPDLYSILAQTEGVVVFHEQVISIIALMTGISLAAADEKRRALGSKESQQEVCDWFFPAATARGYELTTITEIWDVLRAFASFGFCKAHAAAFALPTYQSAYLKTHYPAAFIAGVLTHDPGMYPKRLMIDEARQLGVGLAPLDINLSGSQYTVEKNENGGESVRIALTSVSGISDKEVTSIIAGRPYLDLADFYRRSGASHPVIETLIMTGALDQVHSLKDGVINHRDLLLHLSDLTRSPVANIGGSQMVFGFAPPDVEASGLPAMGAAEKVRNEVERLGMDISHHMLEFYAPFLNAIGAVKSSDLLSLRSQSEVLVAGIKVAMQTPPVRSGRRVIFLTLDDGYGCTDSTFFSDAQEGFASTLYSSSILLVRGTTRRTGDRGISINANGAWDLRAAYEKWSRQLVQQAIQK